MRVIQPSIANRITFATFARKAGLRRHSNVSYYVPDDLEVPAKLLNGAQVDGKPYQAPEDKPKAKRTRKPKVEIVEPEVTPEPEPEVEHSEPEEWQPTMTQRSQTTEED